jgi:hypothetical protein
MLLRTASLAIGLAIAAPATLAYADNTPVAAEHAQAPARPTPSAQDTTSYQQREQKDQKAADYKGGDLLVVGVSGGAIIIILLLLLILI